MTSRYYPLGEPRDAVPFWHEPPGRVFHSAVALLAAFTLWAVSVPGWFFLPAMISVGVWALAGLAWAIRVTFYNWLRMRRPLAAPPPRSLARWSLAPVVALFTAGTAVLGLPERVRFVASRGELERAAAAALADPAYSAEWRDLENARIGWFDV